MDNVSYLHQDFEGAGRDELFSEDHPPPYLMFIITNTKIYTLRNTILHTVIHTTLYIEMNIILPTSSKMYWTLLYKLYLTLYCVLYCTVYCTKTSKCLAEVVYSLRNSFLPDCVRYWTLYCLMYWTLHCKFLQIWFSSEK